MSKLGENTISKLEEADAILTLISMTDEVASDVKDETALAAMAARRLLREALSEIEDEAAPIPRPDNV